MFCRNFQNREPFIMKEITKRTQKQETMSKREQKTDGG